MKQHYSPEQWQTYRNGDLDHQTSLEMEDHLLICPVCLDHFLNTISQEDVLRAEQVLPADFTQTTVALVSKTRIQISKPARQNAIPKRLRRRLFGYYVAAAVITLALMGGGVFESMVDRYPQAISMCTMNDYRDKPNIHLKNLDKVQPQEWFRTLTNKNRGGIDFELKK
ncbi:MAG: hypothetical protein U9N81_07345 [Bacillota bacterium]|nr:hypothetical protein [Bacillota bacterium]